MLSALLRLQVVSALCTFQVPSAQTFLLSSEVTLDYHSNADACPDLMNGPVCCTDTQNTLMHTAFHLIDLALGSVSGGCDVCAASLKRLWCHFVCSPMQSQFVSAHNFTAPRVDFAVTPATTHSLFEVCKGSPLVARLPEMQTPIGFLQFQAEQSQGFGPLLIRVVESQEKGALDITFEPCDTPATTLYGYEITPCTCSACEALCSSRVHRPLAFALTVADWLGVGLAYCCFAGFVVVLALVLWVRQPSQLGKKTS